MRHLVDHCVSTPDQIIGVDAHDDDSVQWERDASGPFLGEEHRFLHGFGRIVDPDSYRLGRRDASRLCELASAALCGIQQILSESVAALVPQYLRVLARDLPPRVSRVIEGDGLARRFQRLSATGDHPRIVDSCAHRQTPTVAKVPFPTDVDRLSGGDLGRAGRRADPARQLLDAVADLGFFDHEWRSGIEVER